VPHYSYNILPFYLAHVALLMLKYTQGMNRSCALPQVAYCFHCELGEDAVSSVPEDILWYWLGSYLGLSAHGRCVLHAFAECCLSLHVLLKLRVPGLSAENIQICFHLIYLICQTRSVKARKGCFCQV